MKDLSTSTRIYLSFIYFIGFGLFLWSVLLTSNQRYIDGGYFIFAGILFPDFKVDGATNRSHYTFSFLIYGFAFLYFGIGETLLVILISNLAEWVWNRPPWYIQIFNISCYIIAMSAAFLVFSLINPSGSLSTPLGILSVALSMGGLHLA